MASPPICNRMVIYVHKNSLEEALVPTGTDHGKIKPCSVYRRLSKLVPAASRRPGRPFAPETQTEGRGRARRQREAPGERKPGASWSQPCFSVFFLFCSSHPKLILLSARAGCD